MTPDQIAALVALAEAGEVDQAVELLRPLIPPSPLAGLALGAARAQLLTLRTAARSVAMADALLAMRPRWETNQRRAQQAAADLERGRERAREAVAEALEPLP